MCCCLTISVLSVFGLCSNFCHISRHIPSFRSDMVPSHERRKMLKSRIQKRLLRGGVRNICFYFSCSRDLDLCAFITQRATYDAFSQAEDQIMPGVSISRKAWRISPLVLRIGVDLIRPIYRNIEWKNN